MLYESGGTVRIIYTSWDGVSTITWTALHHRAPRWQTHKTLVKPEANTIWIIGFTIIYIADREDFLSKEQLTSISRGTGFQPQIFHINQELCMIT